MSEGDGAFDAYRAVNERVREEAARIEEGGARSEPWEFMCECGQSGCREHVRLLVSEFDAVVASGGTVLADGHAVVAAGQIRARSRLLNEDAQALRAQAEQVLRHAKRLRRKPPD